MRRPYFIFIRRAWAHLVYWNLYRTERINVNFHAPWERLHAFCEHVHSFVWDFTPLWELSWVYWEFSWLYERISYFMRVVQSSVRKFIPGVCMYTTEGASPDYNSELDQANYLVRWRVERMAVYRTHFCMQCSRNVLCISRLIDTRISFTPDVQLTVTKYVCIICSYNEISTFFTPAATYHHMYECRVCGWETLLKICLGLLFLRVLCVLLAQSLAHVQSGFSRSACRWHVNHVSTGSALCSSHGYTLTHDEVVQAVAGEHTGGCANLDLLRLRERRAQRIAWGGQLWLPCVRGVWVTENAKRDIMQWESIAKCPF